MGHQEKTKSKANWNRECTRNQVKSRENISSKVIEDNFPNLRKGIHIKVEEAYREPNRLGQKRNFPQHRIIKTLNLQKKESILKGARKKTR